MNKAEWFFGMGELLPYIALITTAFVVLFQMGFDTYRGTVSNQCWEVENVIDLQF